MRQLQRLFRNQQVRLFYNLQTRLFYNRQGRWFYNRLVRLFRDRRLGLFYKQQWCLLYGLVTCCLVGLTHLNVVWCLEVDSAHHTGAPEIVTNSGFDLDKDHNGLPDGWYTSHQRIRLEEEPYMSGNYVLVSRPNNYVLAIQNIRLKKGHVYTLRVRVKTENEGLAGVLIVHGEKTPSHEMPLLWRVETGPKFEEVVRTFVAPNPVAKLFIYNVARTRGTVFYDKVSIREGTPETPVIVQLSLQKIDRPLEPPPKTPHLCWAKPLVGPPLKAFIVIHSLRCLRQVVELEQRLSLDDDVVQAGSVGSLPVAETGRRAMKRLKRDEYEVYVVDSVLDAALNKAIKKRVEKGAGLVVVEGLGRTRQFLNPKALKQVSSEHFLLRNTIPSLMPAKILKAVQVGRLGKGRVVRLVFPYSTARVWGLFPMEVSLNAWKRRQFEYWEWWESLLAKAVLWAARGEPPVSLQFRRLGPKTVELKAVGATRGAELKARVVVRSGREIRFDGPLLRTAPKLYPFDSNGLVRVSLPATFPAGPVIVDATVLNKKGEALTWGSTVVRTAQAVAVTKLHVEPSVVTAGRNVQAIVHVKVFKADKPVQIQAKVVDAFGRVTATVSKPVSFKAEGTKATEVQVRLRLPVNHPLCVLQRVCVQALVQGQEQDRRWTTVLVPAVGPAKAASDFLAVPWVPGASPPVIWGWYAERTSKLGLNGLFAGDLFLTAEQGMPGGGYMRGLSGIFRETKRSPHGIRSHCLSDPKVVKEIQQRARAAAALQKDYGLFAVGITDEAFLSSRHSRNELCFSPHCRQRFRQWLKQQYGTLSQLNEEWDTHYESWDQVRGWRTEEVRQRTNFAPFVDFRTFMTEVWCQACRQAVQAYHSVSPETPVGHTNTFGANPFNGNDYWKLCTQVGFGWGQEYSEAIKASAHKAIFDLWRSFCETPEAREARTLPGQSVRPFFNYGWIGYNHCREAAHYEPWWLALHGSRGVSYFATNALAADLNRSYALVYPTLSFTGYSLAVQEALADLRAGCGKLFMEFERERPPIALLWSHPSMLVAWCESRSDQPVPNENDGTDSYGSYFRSALFFRRHLNELQLDYHYVSPRQILQDEELRHDRLLFLPFTVAASAELVDKLVEYVRNGGVVVGDLRCLRTDTHGKPVTSRPSLLEQLFGVRRAGPVRYDRTLVRFTGSEEGIGLPGRTFEAFGYEHLEPVQAVPLAKLSNGQPAVAVRRLGKGLTVYLNFGLPAYDVTFRELLAQLVKRAGVARAVSVERLKQPGPPPVCYERNTFHRGPITVHAFIRDYRRCSDSDPVRIHFNQTAYVYDVRAGKALGRTDSVTTVLPPGETAVYALLPYQVSNVEVSVPRTAIPVGKEVPVRVHVKRAAPQNADSTVQPGDHILHVEVFRPDGSSVQPYAQNVLAVHGAAVLNVPLALNDPPGRWRVEVRDVLSGCRAVAEFDVSPQRAP